MNLWLFIHLAGVVLLLGNSFTSAFWKIRSDAAGDPKQAYRTAKNIMIADYIFTLPSIAMILISGHVLAARGGHSVLEWNWLGLSYGLFALSGVIWMAALLPAQMRMIRQGKISCERHTITPAYRQASRIWNVFGVAATLTPLAAMVLMIWKPNL